MEENMTKERLIQEIRDERMRLERTLAKVSEQEMVTPGVMDTWTVKDFLAHITVWERRMIAWLAQTVREEV